jgi:hypothetical protein
MINKTKLGNLLLSLGLLTLLLPLVILKKRVVHYTALRDITYYDPRPELFAVPIGFFILFFILKILEK